MLFLLVNFSFFRFDRINRECHTISISECVDESPRTEPGVISSPLYPMAYPPFQECMYLIQLPPIDNMNRIQIKFISFDLPDPMDYLSIEEVFEGPGGTPVVSTCTI